ncbi:MAG: hypothetical protein V4733_00910 [Verrucomicrobiota bacterium]
MFSRFPVICAAIFASALPAAAQYVTNLKLDRKQYLAGEPVMATITITNHSGVTRVFANDGRLSWLDFILRTSQGHPVTPRGKHPFGPMKIDPGQTLAREIDLNRHFMLSNVGNFSVSAVIRPPGPNSEATPTNRVLFTQQSGSPLWQQKVGINGGTQTREFKLLRMNGPQRSHLYAQVVDNASGHPINTFLLGDMLSLRRPLNTVDRHQRMHTMFLATPTAWIHCCVDSDGRLITRQIHYRAATGDPQLVTSSDGSVVVVNSIPYNPQAEEKRRATIRKASDRPPGAN